MKHQKNLHPLPSNLIDKEEQSPGLISIHEELTPPKQELHEEINIHTQNNWSQEDMLNTWSLFAEKLKINKKINAYNIFTRHQPIKKNNKLVIELVSLSEKAEFQDIQIDLLNCMKTNLKNNDISIEIRLTQKENKKSCFH